MPALWGGLLLILLFSRGTGLLGLLPAQGFPDTGWATPGKALSCLLLPALTTGITAGASIMRYTRAAVGDMASSQAVDMAMACGMTRKQAVLRVALRLATAQLVSVVGLTFAQMITGVMVVENLFALPGLGAMLVTDVGNRDLIAVQSELFLLAAFFLLLGLVVDLTHRALDPRRRFGKGGSMNASKPAPSSQPASSAQTTSRPMRSVTDVTSTATMKTVLSTIWAKAGGKYALIVIGAWLLVSALSLVWTPYSLLDTNGFNAWASPSAAHPLGTDGTGADVLSWLMAGSRTNLMIAVLTVVVAAAIGLLLVAAMVSRSGALASTSVVVVDALISIPTVLIALILSVPFGASAAVVIAACGCAYGLNLARILRPSALLAARSAYVESALWSGASSVRVFFTHIVPNTLPVLCVQLSMSAGTSLLAEAGLTYLGVGVGAGVPSWGHSLSTSVKFISIYPMAVLWPGLVVTMVVVALNLFGDALRDALDPLTNPALREAA